MKIVCINIGPHYGLTINKIYDTDPKWDDPGRGYYRIKNDHNTVGDYEHEFFKLIEHYREEKINEILE